VSTCHHAWRVIRLRMEERPPIWRVDENILNKQSRRAYKGWSTSLGDVRGANNSSSKHWPCHETDTYAWDLDWYFGTIGLRKGTGGGLLRMRLLIFGFHKMRGISWLAEKILL